MRALQVKFRHEETPMPRVMVITDDGPAPSVMLLDEQVSSIHLDSEHAARQFIERLGWAISDAEDAEREQRGTGRVRRSVARERLAFARSGPARRERARPLRA